ncbi:TIGR03862 family flavoprotein [bacterium]|nr:TIGR03862 family flavoprotein [bacterium]
MKNLTIIGGGPAALMLAAQIDTRQYKVTLYDQKKAVGRKFLVAGEGGLNLTFKSPLNELISKYSPDEFMAPFLRVFTNDDLINWLSNLGVGTFIGSSNRVFPQLELKPIEVLNRIIEHIKSKHIKFVLKTKWTGWNTNGQLCFEGLEPIESDVVVFALGGSSWKVTGSDGKWNELFKKQGITVQPFRAANCAFKVNWNKEFITAHEGKPLKNIAVSFNNYSAKGELVISKLGLEGNAIYALSENIQNQFITQKSVTIQLDLKPTMTTEQIQTTYKKAKLSKATEILKKDLNLDRTAISILKHFTDKDLFFNPDLLAKTIKAVPVILHSAEELDKAISTLGGINLNEVNENLQASKIPNTYIIGEMLNWYAPTGGYLLQGCFSMGFAIAKHLNERNNV